MSEWHCERCDGLPGRLGQLPPAADRVPGGLGALLGLCHHPVRGGVRQRFRVVKPDKILLSSTSHSKVNLQTKALEQSDKKVLPLIPQLTDSISGCDLYLSRFHFRSRFFELRVGERRSDKTKINNHSTVHQSQLSLFDSKWCTPLIPTT